MTLHYLSFDLSESDSGVSTLEALAATPAAHHAAVMTEVQQVLDWAAANFPHGQGPIDEGGDWDHDLQVHIEPGGWHAVTLTLAASPRFTEAMLAAFVIDPS
jgi:hypothetical protein